MMVLSLMCGVWKILKKKYDIIMCMTGSTKTVLIAQADRKFDFFTQTQGLMPNALSSFTATVDQSKVVCFFKSTVASRTSGLWS